MNKSSKNVGHSSFFVRNGRQYPKRKYKYFKIRALGAEKYFQGKALHRGLKLVSGDSSMKQNKLCKPDG